MTTTWGPGLQAEHAYRREQLLAAARGVAGSPAGGAAGLPAPTPSGRSGHQRRAGGWGAWTLPLRRWSGATPS